MKSIMTVDLEYDWDSKKTSNITEIVHKLLDLFDDYKIKATFFVVGEIAKKFEDLIKDIAKTHEIASHSYSHVKLNKLTIDELRDEIKKSKQVLQNLRISCHGFRAPFFITNPYLFEILKEQGFTYDSSLSTFFPGRYFHPLIKTKPFIKERLLELPIPNYLPYLIPAGFSYYRLFYPVSRLFKRPYMFYMHPCEFLDGKVTGKTSPIVRKLYSFNRGKKALGIFKQLIESLDIEWMSCVDYIKKHRLNT